jgi:hypothetical protein
MRTKLFIPLLTIVLTGFILLFACNKKSDDGCQSCNFQPDGSTVMSIKLQDESMMINVNYFTGEKAKVNDHQIGMNTIDKPSFEKLLKFVYKSTGKKNEHPFAVVLYFNGEFINTSEISDNNVIGFSYFLISDNRMYHYLYEKVNQSYKVVSPLSFEVGRIFFKQMDFIVLNVLQSYSGLIKSYVLFIEEGTSIPNQNQSKNKFLLLLPILERQYIKTKTYVGYGGYCPPSFPCPGPLDDASCMVDPNTGIGSCLPGCGFSAESGNLQDNDTIVPTNLYQAFDSQLLHNFRDNFMMNSSLGQKYIEYYYALSGYLGDDIPLSLSIQTAWFLYYHNSDIAHLLDTTNHSNDVIINDNFSEALCSLIQGYRSLSTDTTYIHMIDEIQSNVENLQGKTIRQILHEIK